MKKRIFRPVQGAVVLMACLAAGAWADDTLVLTSAGASTVMGGVYTSPYGITVNGTPMLLICDDFTTDISIGQTWQAVATTPPLTQINSTTVTGLKFDSSPSNAHIMGGSGKVVQDYAVAAVLAAELLMLPNVGTPSESATTAETAGEISYAMWSVFDTTLYNSLNSNGATGFGTLTGTEVAAVDGYITAAQSLVSGATTGSGASLSVNLNSISINGQTISGLTAFTPNPTTASQEFLKVSMPEPSSLAILAVDLLGVLGLIAMLRRRLGAKLS